MAGKNIDTNPLDRILAGDVFQIDEGQLRMVSPIIIFDTGELRVIDNGTLVFEE